MLNFAAVIIVVGGLKTAAGFFTPIFVAIFLTLLLSPSVKWLTERGAPKALAVLLVAVLAVAAGMATTVVLGDSLVRFSRQLPLYAVRVEELEAQFYQWLSGFGLNVDLEGSTLDANLAPARLMGVLVDLLNAVRGLLTNGVLILILMVFMLVETGHGRRRIEAAFGADSGVPEALDHYAHRIVAYVKVKTWMSLATGACVFLALWLLRIDFAALWGVLAFLLNYVPTIGSLMAAVPPVVLALLQYGFGRALLVIGAVVLINNIISNFLEPRLMGQQFGMPPWIIFAAFLFWAWVLGPVGMLLAVPLTVALKLTLESFQSTRSVAALMSK